MRKISFILCGALLAGCHGGLSLPSSTGWPNSAQGQAVTANTFASLYSFKNGSDGAYPYAGLTEVNGAFYGTTYGGGTSGGWGTVFKVSPSGDEHVIYKFKAGDDGAHPYAGLTGVNGMLYGTTYQGGAGGAGTVFKVSPSGDEHVLYSFKGGSDGVYPYGRLLALGGQLYGTTYQGGASTGWGIVFKVSLSGQEQVLYRFQANDKKTHDGAHPYAGLTDVNGVLFGTTYQGGTNGAGTVFKVSTAGSEHVIYSFKAGADGQYPLSKLIFTNGVLYGTTYGGGISPGWGVVFKVTTAGTERVLYRFEANKDGAHPQYAGLVSYNGKFYGTTYQGGSSGAGTVFSVTPGGTEHVIFSFNGGSDGLYPYAGLTLVKGALYSTTYQGGGQNYGSVFKVVP